MEIKIPDWLPNVAGIMVLVLIIIAIVSSIIHAPIIRRATPQEMLEKQNLVWEQYLEIKKNIKD